MLGVAFVEGMSVILAKSLELRCGAARKRSLEVCSCFGIGRVSQLQLSTELCNTIGWIHQLRRAI